MKCIVIEYNSDIKICSIICSRMTIIMGAPTKQNLKV